MPDLALIGAGYWGRNLARNFLQLGVLGAICDPDASILASYGEEYSSVRKLASVSDVFADSSIAKVVIATPATLHYRLAQQALNAGKDVFVEKPLCLEISEGEELMKLAEQRHCVLMVGHLLQYHPCIRTLQALVAQGELGKLHYIISNRLNLGKIRKEENALWSFAPHDLSVILSLAGNQLPEEVRCSGEAYLTPNVADTTLTTLRFRDGVRAHVFVSWLNPFKEQKLTVVGSNGMAVFDDTKLWEDKLTIYRQHLTWKGGQVPIPSKAGAEKVKVPEAEPLHEECAHFLECCQTRKAPRTDAIEGIRVLTVLQLAQKSLDRNGEIETPQRFRSAKGYSVHETAIVDDGAIVGARTKIWHFSHVMKGAEVGENCNLGQNVVVSPGVRLGRNVKVQNNVSLYTGVECEDDVFLGPSCVLTNVTNPRSQVNRRSLYEKTLIRRGATIGANATIVCGVTIGRYAFIAAGAVVTREVPDYGLMVGNPARRKGWMSRHGHVLHAAEDGTMSCPESGFCYREESPDVVRCVELREDDPLPPGLTSGDQSYDELKAARTFGRD